MSSDTIAAIATAPGAAGIGIIRISGTDALAVADRVFTAASGTPLEKTPGGRAVYGRIVGDTAETIDEAIALVMRAPHSYTREDVVELQCHGDPTEWRNIFIRELPVTTVDPARIGVCSWSWQKSYKGVAEEMEKAGIKGIHLALGPLIFPDERHGAAEGAEALAFVKEQVKSGKWNLMCTMIGTIGEDYSTLETIKKTGGIVPDEHWAKNQEIVTKGAKLTQELGCKYMSLHGGFLDESDPVAFKKYVERVSWMRDEAKKYGVTIILESGQETAEDLAKFMQAVPGVGINFDPANMILYAKGQPMEALRTLIPWIKQVHIKDALLTQKPGTWGTEVAWGDGEVGGRMFLSELKALGYKGNYVIEREGGNARVKEINQAKERLTK